ncbi:glycoside hydrolase family 105 protein [Pedobacter sp. SYSU D00535]|uniref:glycoside hydrolase family 88/105 protein n=1 Tax=Pedobacter sp. SYSU D00535 TaxID=2810308 RepID=UPI001A966811|nr:glycoside hydrolase family 88 protein [Pedobacter sp. SYSU D00535]
MKIKHLFLIFLTLTSLQSQAQNNEEVVRKIANQILKETVLGFEGTNDKRFYKASSEIPEGTKVKYASPYTGWHYTHGVLNIAMMNLGTYLNDSGYWNYAGRHIDFGLNNYKVFEQRFKGDVKHYTYPYGELFTMEELDDFGAMSASMIEVYKKNPKPEYKAYLEKAAKHLMEDRVRLEDGTYVRAFPHKMTLWADDLYMSVPFLARMGALTGEKKYTDDAIKQVKNFNKYLWDEDKNIYWHTYYSDVKRNGVAHWGRCNGWIMLATIHLIDNLPAKHPEKQNLIKLLERQILGLAQYQNGDGLWHQILDKNDSYVESSCSAMFVYGTAHAVNEGWLDKRYASIARTGWEGLKKHKINELGQLKDICVGTGIQDNLPFYYNRPVGTNEKHGTGPLIDAGVEILKLEKGAK